MKNKSLFNDLKRELFAQSFNIEFDDALTFPTNAKIREYIENHCKNMGVVPNFIDIDEPVTFMINEKKYSSDVRMARGGYYILCKEV